MPDEARPSHLALWEPVRVRTNFSRGSIWISLANILVAYVIMCKTIWGILPAMTEFCNEDISPVREILLSAFGTWTTAGAGLTIGGGSALGRTACAPGVAADCAGDVPVDGLSGFGAVST